MDRFLLICTGVSYSPYYRNLDRSGLSYCWKHEVVTVIVIVSE